ncbi:hypothetical protein ACHWQZ_G002252 [Mnemiopsis leidyi]
MESTEWMLHSAEKELNTVFERTILTFKVEKLEDLTSTSALSNDVSKEAYADLLYQFVLISHRIKLVLKSAADQIEVMKSGMKSGILELNGRMGDEKSLTLMSETRSNIDCYKKNQNTKSKEEDPITAEVTMGDSENDGCFENKPCSIKETELTKISGFGLKSDCVEMDKGPQKETYLIHTPKVQFKQNPDEITEECWMSEEKLIPNNPNGKKKYSEEIYRGNKIEQALAMSRERLRFSSSIKWKTSIISFKKEVKGWGKSARKNFDGKFNSSHQFIRSIHFSTEEKSFQNLIIFGADELENDLDRPVHLNFIVDEVLKNVLNSEISHLSDIISCRRVGTSDKQRTAPRPIKVKMKPSDMITRVISIATERKRFVDKVAEDNCTGRYKVAVRREDVYIYRVCNEILSLIS